MMSSQTIEYHVSTSVIVLVPRYFTLPRFISGAILVNTTKSNSPQAFIALMSIVIASSAEKNIITSWTNRHFVSLVQGIMKHANCMKHVCVS